MYIFIDACNNVNAHPYSRITKTGYEDHSVNLKNYASDVDQQWLAQPPLSLALSPPK